MRSPKQQRSIFENAPAIKVYTPEHGLWSGSNNFGIETLFAPDANNRQTILKLDEYGEPTPWTVALGVKDLNATVGGVAVTALIDFGVGGSTQRIECDWLEGALISFPANTINVQAFWEDIQGIEGLGARLYVTVSRGARFTQAQKTIVTSTFPNGVFTVPNGGGLAGIPIPKFTRNIKVLPAYSTAAQLTAFHSATFLAMTTAQANGSERRNVVRGTELANGLSLPVSGQGRYVRFENGTASDIDVLLIAELA